MAIIHTYTWTAQNDFVTASLPYKNSTSPVVFTMPWTPVAGNTLIMIISCGAIGGLGNLTYPSADFGNTLTQSGCSWGPLVGRQRTVNSIQAFCAQNIGTAGSTITVNPLSFSGTTTVVLMEVDNCPTGTPTIPNGYASEWWSESDDGAFDTSRPAGSITTTAASSILIAAWNTGYGDPFPTHVSYSDPGYSTLASERWTNPGSSSYNAMLYVATKDSQPANTYEVKENISSSVPYTVGIHFAIPQNAEVNRSASTSGTGSTTLNGTLLQYTSGSLTSSTTIEAIVTGVLEQSSLCYKSPLTQELVNTFPSWTKTRNNDQSLGYQILNTIAKPMETMQNKLFRMNRNNHIPTCNLKELDILYKVQLPTTVEFGLNYSDPVNPQATLPEVTGTIDDTTYTITGVPTNSLEEFWETSLPTRFNIEEPSVIDPSIYSGPITGLPVSGIFEHHLGGGYVYIQTTGGIKYVTLENQKVYRGTVIITGRTRKGTFESETLVFPWDMKQSTDKEWSEIYKIESYNMESDVQIDISFSDVYSGPYISFYNNRFSENRNKIDEFWDIGVGDTYSTLDYITYISDDWRQLVQGFSSKEVRNSWELISNTYENFEAVDLAIEPFTTRAWIVDTNANLYCYDTHDYMIHNVDLLLDKTPGSQVQLEVESTNIVLGEEIRVVPWHALPVREIKKFRIWFQTPQGDKYGWKFGEVVAYSNNLWMNDDGILKRSITNTIVVPAEERGEYLFVIEAIFVDDETQIDKVIVPVRHKMPLSSWDLRTIGVEGDVLGLEFSSDQDLWVSTTSGYYKLEPHYDIMLVDYTRKVIYFREQYDSVEVTTDD